MVDSKLQEMLTNINVTFNPTRHIFEGVDASWKPWLANLSPSALYNCSLVCRKALKMKTPETKWVSLKRWIQTTPSGYKLPEGVFLSIKRKEVFVSTPTPHFEKIDHLILMFPYGNVWPLTDTGKPITEDYLLGQISGRPRLLDMMDHDAENPLTEYFKLCKEFMDQNPDQIGIHLKRKRKPE